PRPPNDAIRQAERDEAVFEFAHLERGTHQNGGLVERVLFPALAAPLQLFDLLADGARFLLGIPGAGDGDLFAELVLGAQRLAEAALVMGDQVRGSGKDVAGGAVMALEANDGGAGEVVLEAQDVVDLGAAPAIDRLIVVADAADVFRPNLRRVIRRPLRQQSQPQILRDIGVLIFVDQAVSEAALILAQHVGLFAEQADLYQKQVAEIGGIENFQALLIFLLEL